VPSRDDRDIRADYESLASAQRASTHAPLKGGGIRKRRYDLLNLVLAGKREIRRKTRVAIGIPPIPKQDISHSVHDIHDSPTCCMLA
jgi:hypothetical protein